MNKESKMELPGNLKGYTLKKAHHNSLVRIIIWMVIILVALWFINKEIVLSLFEGLKNLVGSFT